MSNDRRRLVSVRTGSNIGRAERHRASNGGGGGGSGSRVIGELPCDATFGDLTDVELIDKAVAVTLDPDTREPITYKRFADVVLCCNDRTLRKYRNGRRLPGLERKTLVSILRDHDARTRRAAMLASGPSAHYDIGPASTRPRAAVAGGRRKADAKRRDAQSTPKRSSSSSSSSKSAKSSKSSPRKRDRR